MIRSAGRVESRPEAAPGVQSGVRDRCLGYRPCCRRCQRVFFRSFLCFFLRMRLRRFLIREPMREERYSGRGAGVTFSAIGRGRQWVAVRSIESVGGGVTAARGPLESQVEVRNLAPEHRSTGDPIASEPPGMVRDGVDAA